MDKNLERLSNIAKEEKTKEKETVNHPAHYNRPNSMECIDEMLLVFGREAVMNFCLCNAWKYRYRASDKNGAEDIAKSDWYLAKYKELKDTNEKAWEINPNNITIQTIPCATKAETMNIEYINENSKAIGQN